MFYNSSDLIMNHLIYKIGNKQMKNHDLVLTISNLLKTNKGYFKSEKQANFILSSVADNEIVNHFTTYKNIARDHYRLDDKGVYKIERYTTKKGYVTTWERGQVHNLEAAKNRDDSIRQMIQENQIKTLGYCVDSKDFYAFIDLFNELNSSAVQYQVIKSFGSDLNAIAEYLNQVSDFCAAVQDFKNKYFSCNP